MSRVTVRLDEGAEQRIEKMIAAGVAADRSDAIRRSLVKADEPAPRNPYGELGSSGLSRWGGSVRDEQLRELRGAAGRRKYHEMEDNNAVIGAVLFALSMYLRKISFFAEAASDSPEDQRAAEFLDECLGDMSFTWDDELQFILTMMTYGFSILEIVYKLRRGPDPKPYEGVSDPASSQYNDGLIGWRKWAPRPWQTLKEGDEWIFDEHGGVQGINITLPQKSSIPIEYLLLFRTTPAPSNSPEGRSVLRNMYEPYYYSTNIAEIEGIGVERDLAGLPVIYLGTDCSMIGTNSDYELAKKLVENIRNDEQAGIVIPKPKMGMAGEGQGILLELLSSSGGKAFNTDAIINRWDKRIAMSLLAQFIMLGMEQVGSYSLSQHQGDVFAIALEAWASSICQTISRHAVPRLFKLNPQFRVEQVPILTHSPAGVPNLDQFAKFVNSMVGAMVLTPDDDLERHVREMAGLPPKMEQVDMSRQPQQPPTPPPQPEAEQPEEPGTETPELEEPEQAQASAKGRARYGRWLSEAAPVISQAAPADRIRVIKRAIDDLAFLLGQPDPQINYAALAQQDHGYDHRDGLVQSVARRIVQAAKAETVTDVEILSAGMSLFHLFDGLEKRDRQFAQAVLGAEEW